MDWNTVTIALITGLIGAVIGSILSYFLQSKLQRKIEVRRQQFDCFKTMMKYKAVSRYAQENKDGVAALNLAPALFGEEPSVQQELDKYFAVSPVNNLQNEQQRSRIYIDVCAAMARLLVSNKATYESINMGWYPKYEE
jgi:hypothetical protein